MMVCFKATVKPYRKGEEVPMPQGRVGVVQSGKISLIKIDANGGRTIFEQLREGGVFGDALGFARADASLYLLADEDCRVLYIDYEHIVKRCPNACTHHSTASKNIYQCFIVRVSYAFSLSPLPCASRLPPSPDTVRPRPVCASLPASPWFRSPHDRPRCTPSRVLRPPCPAPR